MTYLTLFQKRMRLSVFIFALEIIIFSFTSHAFAMLEDKDHFSGKHTYTHKVKITEPGKTEITKMTTTVSFRIQDILNCPKMIFDEIDRFFRGSSRLNSRSN